MGRDFWMAFMTAAFLLHGCGPTHIDDKATPEPSVTTISFADMMDQYGAILVGEWHGNEQMPRVFGDMVAQAAETRRQVVVALEYDRRWKADLENYLISTPQDNEIPFSTHGTQ